MLRRYCNAERRPYLLRAQGMSYTSTHFTTSTTSAAASKKKTYMLFIQRHSLPRPNANTLNREKLISYEGVPGDDAQQLD
jgi:hypothetical protein